MKFDENLRALRKEKDFSQEYLAFRMNVSRQTISKWENGTAMPDLKKLTELADLFETSMDELLGTSAPTVANTQVAENSKEIELLNKKLDIVQNSLEQSQKKHSRINIFLCTAIIILAAGLVITSIITSDSIRNLQDSINRVSNEVFYHSNNYQSNDNEEHITDDVEYFISSVDKEEPNMIELTVKYTPKSYAKGTEVKIALSDKSDDVITAELIGNSFVAKLKLDVTKVSDLSISVDDGKSITTDKLYFDWESMYGAFDESLVFYYKNVSIQDTDITSEINFDSEYLVSRENRDGMPKIIEAFFEAENENGKTLYSEKLNLIKNKEYTSVTVEMKDFVDPGVFYETTGVKPKKFVVSGNVRHVIIRLVDELGTTYIIRCIDESPDAAVQEEYNNFVSIIFKNGKEAAPHTG